MKNENELMFLSSGGRAFKDEQRRGAERLNALCPMGVRRAEGTDRSTEEEDLREREGMGRGRGRTDTGEQGCGWP